MFEFFKDKNVIRVISLLFAFIAVSIVVFAFVLSSQLGGMLQISYENYVMFFENRYLIMFTSFLMLGFYVYTNYKYKFFHKKSSIILTLVVFGFAILARFYLPLISFSTYQNKALFFPIKEASKYIDKDDREMIVVDYNGEVKAFSNKVSFLPHIISGDFGDEHIIMAYCVLSSLPIAFKDDLNGQKMDLSVLLAPMNNLLMYDHNSGELIKQLKLETEDTQTPLDLIPVQKMPWHTFKKLYPKGEVFLPVNSNIFQKLMYTVIGETIDPIIEGEKLFYKPMHFVNPKLPETERVWGLLVNGEPMALTKDYLNKHEMTSIVLGGRNILVVYFKDYDTVGAFYNDNKLDVTLDDIDPYGNIGEMKLKRIEGLFNTVFWAAWSYFYPHTGLIDEENFKMKRE